MPQHVNRAGFDIAGNVLEILRHPQQRLVDVRLVLQPRDPSGALILFAVVTRRMHIPSTGVSLVIEPLAAA